VLMPTACQNWRAEVQPKMMCDVVLSQPPSCRHHMILQCNRHHGLVRLASSWWLVLICCERKILLAGWWLLAGAELVWEKSTAGWLGASQPNKAHV
jgi:hypothetical protein